MNLKTLMFPLSLVVVIVTLFFYSIHQRDNFMEAKTALENNIRINNSLVKQLEESQRRVKTLDESIAETIKNKNKENEMLKEDLEKAEKLLEVKNDKGTGACYLNDDVVSLLNKTCNRAKGGICRDSTVIPN